MKAPTRNLSEAERTGFLTVNLPFRSAGVAARRATEANIVNDKVSSINNRYLAERHQVVNSTLVHGVGYFATFYFLRWVLDSVAVYVPLLGIINKQP